MNIHRWWLFTACFALFFAGCQSSKEDDQENIKIAELGNVTSSIKLLGNPLSNRYKDDTDKVYARNIWDMYAFDGKIYFGGGNSSNIAPASNAGPADVWTYNPSTDSFVKEYTLNEEQLHLIREFDNQLYIPGHDSRESWDYGNFYRLESGVWKKYRTIPRGIHVYDIYKFDGKLFAALGTDLNVEPSVVVSNDDGKTWQYIKCISKSGEEEICRGCSGRVYTFFVLSGRLFANYVDAFIYNPEKGIFSNLSVVKTRALFAGTTASRIERTVVFKGEMVYIVGKTINDHQYTPLLLAHAKDEDNVLKVELPNNTLPYDLLIKGKHLFALVSTKNDDNTYCNKVLSTSDLKEWKEIFYFNEKSFARSFEYLNGNFYFGMGCNTDKLEPVTGNVLSVSYP